MEVEAFSEQYNSINETIEDMKDKSLFPQIGNTIERFRTAIESSELDSKIKESMYSFVDQLVLNLVDRVQKFEQTPMKYSVGESVEVIYNCDKNPDVGTIVSIYREHQLDRCNLRRANGKIYSFFLDDLRKLGFYASQTPKVDNDEEKDEEMA